jgi:uncharacterized protein YcbK (DUF882 family)
MAMASALVASCSTGDPSFDLSNPSLAGAEAGAAVANTTLPADDGSAPSDDPNDYVMSDGSPVALPDTVAYVPVSKPAGPFAEGGTAAAAAAPDAATAAPAPTPSTAQAAQAAASDAQAQTAAAAAGAQPSSDPNAAASAAAPAPVPADKDVYVTATDPNQPLAVVPAPKKRSFFAALFGASEANAHAVASDHPKPLIPQESKPKPIIALSSTETKQAEVRTASLGAEANTEHLNALPGVRQSALFEIKRKSGLEDDSDIDVNEDEDYGPVQVATAAGLARMAPNGLITQTEDVDVSCLKPSLVRVLKTVEEHYGKKLVVTSGYRSPERNRRARGARNSLHMYCAAADVQVPGVGKWELAAYFHSMPGRGGVGTYCHTESVHIDIGPERDWNWRCRKRR